MQHIRFRLVGDSPILQNNGESMITLENPPDDWPRGKKWVPSPEVEAEAGVYRLPDGQLGMPAASVLKALLTASTSWSAPKQAGRTMRGSIQKYVGSSLLPVQEMFGLFHPDGSPVMEYALDRRRCTLKAGGSVIRSRPRIDLSWELACIYVWRESIVPVEVLKLVIDEAGAVVGIGNYRPEKKGTYGRFHLEAEPTIVGVG